MSEDEDGEHWWDKAQREHEASLTVGTRVRVDVGECRHFLWWHGTIEQGKTGRIMGLDVECSPRPEDHRYWVWFDWPVRARHSWSYAAHELVPIPEATPEEIVAETLRRVNAAD